MLTVRVDIGFLQGILGVRIVFQDRTGNTERSAVLLPHDSFESRFIPAGDAPRECRIVQRQVGFDGLGCHWARWASDRLRLLDADGVTDVPGRQPFLDADARGATVANLSYG